MMVRCWQVELRYESEGGKPKRMLSIPLTYTNACRQLLYYERRGHAARLVEDKVASAKQLSNIARLRAGDWREVAEDIAING